LYLENRLATSIFTPDRVRVLRLLSSQIAISLDNSALFEKLSDEVDERRRAEAALRLLADAGAALVESLDYETTLVRLAELTIPSLADWCIVDLLDEGGTMRRVAAKHVDASKAPILAEIQERYPPARSSPHPSARVLRSGAPLLHRELPDEVLRTLCVDEEHVQLVRALGARSGLAVPLVARGQTLGVLTLTLASPTRRYGPREVELAQEVARRAATAIDNARLYRNAQEAIRVRDDFLSTASHELRTPVTSLQLVVQSLLRGLHQERSISPEMLTVAARQTDRLTALIGQMLDVTRIQGGKLTLTLEEFDFVANFRRILERAQVDIERAKAPVTLRAGDAIIGRWDRLRIDQLLTNILSNALSYGSGSPIDVTIERVADRVRFEMCDQGIGIAPDRLPHIFERFERATSTRHYGGLGLGLFIARQVVEAHHGTVTVESELGRGSCFTVELPLRPPEKPAP
jgi:signal transduction histidine kinase